MSNIRRLNIRLEPVNNVVTPVPVEVADGPLCYYTDHLAAVSALQAENERLRNVLHDADIFIEQAAIYLTPGHKFWPELNTHLTELRQALAAKGGA